MVCVTSSGQPRAGVTARFPPSSQFADFVLRIERPLDEQGREVSDRGWDILYEKEDGSVGYNHWADNWDEVLLYFADQESSGPAPPWVEVGKFKDAIFPPE